MDDLLRIGQNILAVADIVFHKKCWIRSGLTAQEVRAQSADLLASVSESDEGDIPAAIQAIALNNYLLELVADGKINNNQRKTYLRKWGKL